MTCVIHELFISTIIVREREVENTVVKRLI